MLIISTLIVIYLSGCLATVSAKTKSPAKNKNLVNSNREDCSTNHLQGCMNLLQTINKDHNLAFACTEEELENMCSTMKDGLECVYNHVMRCFDEKRRDVIYNLLQGTEDVITLLCTQGEFRSKYKVYAPCMKNVSTDPRMCGPQYQMLIHSVNPREDISANDSIRRQCCAFHTYLLCVTEIAETECGLEAAEFINDYSYRTAGPLIKNQCRNYMAGSLMCSLSKGKALEVSSSAILLLVTLKLIYCNLLNYIRV